MNRRSLPIATALTAAAALLLTACGGEDGKTETSDKIVGVDKGETKSAPPTASPSGSANRPRTALPKDVQNVFESWKTGDPVKDAVLADVSHRINATDAAIVNGDSNAPALPFYYQGDGLIGAAEWIQGYKDDGLSITGTTRYFKPQIEMLSKASASVVYCSDESKAYNKDRKTGKVDKSPASNDSYVFYSTRLDKNEQGIWQTAKLISKRGHEACTP
ncbi:hypothetical protein ACFWOJ_21770 [Streptomyces sp. NPDC058439]|uniref:hypothetical protein n=1 Tax=Streptomyces sp. NPDC058439 TaxID=3346500 RepID=UPI003655A66A